MKYIHSLLRTAIISVAFAIGPAGAFAQNPGSLDLSFDPGTGANEWVGAAAIQSDGKIVIGGAFTTYNGTPRKGIARLNADGSLDTTFDPGEGVFGFGVVRTTAVQSDGKILIGGLFSSINGIPRNSIARLNEDGSLDPTFDPISGVDPAGSLGVLTIAIQSAGKILIGGFFSIVNGIPRNGIARMNADGSLDPTFDPGTGVGPDGAEAHVVTISIQSDGRTIIGGQFYSYDGTPRDNIARLNLDGSLDTSFDGATSGNVLATALQSDGRIVVAGRFLIPSSRIARLNSDGSVDATFDPGSGVGGPVIEAIAIQSDGRIVIGGGFWSYSGTPRNNIARLNSDGSLDMTFDPGVGTNQGVSTVAIQNDGRIIIGGGFASYDGIPRNSIARLNGEGTVDIDDIASFEFSIFPNPASTSVCIIIPERPDRAELILRNSLGQQVLRSRLTSGRNEVSLNDLTPGLYAAEVKTTTWRSTQWLVVE